MRNSLVTSVVIAALAVTAASVASAEVKKGARAPEPDGAKDARGKTWKLKSQRGKWVVMTFGGSWCKPCKKELPAWDKLALTWKDKVTFVAVNLDNDSAKGKKFMDGLKIKNLVRLYAPEEKTAAADIYEPPTQPSSYLIDPNGIVVDIHEGYSSGDEKSLSDTLGKLVK
jgi:cytochrome c biogenesis protein CcmG, thiol:disulfide interchange protein DsbE